MPDVPDSVDVLRVSSGWSGRLLGGEQRGLGAAMQEQRGRRRSLWVLAAVWACTAPSKEGYFQSRADGYVYRSPLEPTLAAVKRYFDEQGRPGTIVKNQVLTAWLPDPREPGSFESWQATAEEVDALHTRVRIVRLLGSRLSRSAETRLVGRGSPGDLVTEQEAPRSDALQVPAQLEAPRIVHDQGMEWALLQRFDPAAAAAIREEETVQSGCGTVRAPVRPVPAPSLVVETKECPDVPGSEALLYAGRLVVLGELSGTEQGPRFVGALTCKALAAGMGVVVALELPRSSAPELEAFLTSQGQPSDRAALLASPAFTREWHDGRDSAALLELLERLRQWRQAGASVEVVAFDDPSATRDFRDAAMADLLEPIRRSHLDRPMLVLIGNLHASTTPGRPVAGYRPFSARLEEVGLRPVALQMAFGAGTFWGCDMSGGGFGCGVHETRGWPPPPPPTPRTAEDRGTSSAGMGAVGDPAPATPLPPMAVRLGSTRSEGFDGLFWVGTVTASVPAKR